MPIVKSHRQPIRMERIAPCGPMGINQHEGHLRPLGSPWPSATVGLLNRQEAAHQRAVRLNARREFDEGLVEQPMAVIAKDANSSSILHESFANWSACVCIRPGYCAGAGINLRTRSQSARRLGQEDRMGSAVAKPTP